MSSSHSEASGTKPVQNIFEAKVASSSSSEPPREEWLSLTSLPQDDTSTPKRAKYREGLYDPGSGEICTKYITMSASSVLRHPYYEYPCIIDPGIRQALLEPEEKKIYPLDGQELYLDLCEEMKVIPVKSFFRGLCEETIDLRYYGVNPVSVRAMSVALSYNLHVRRLELTSNFLNEDACYHLGQMLRENITLQELVLHGCRITQPGATAIVNGLVTAKSLHTLDLSYNPLTSQDAFLLVSKLRKKSVKLVNLFMDNVGVDKKFMKERSGVLSLSYRKECTITHGFVMHNYELSTPNLREIVFNRLDYVTSKGSKKSHLDIGVYFLQKKKTLDNMQPREIADDLKLAGIPVDDDLLGAVCDMFPGPKLDKVGKTLDLAGVTDMVTRLWPDRKAPETPPEPVEEPEQEINEKDKKGEKKEDKKAEKK